MDIQLPLQTVVRINYPDGEFTGLVRYCTFREIGYFIGVQFEPGIKWNETSFKPLHLLDPRSLLKKAGGQASSGGGAALPA